MLFNSYEFLFIFLPMVLALFWLLEARYRGGFLVLASVVFYGMWSLEYLGLLVGSIGVNYLSARKIALSKTHSMRGWWLGGAIVANLLPLFYFKYTLITSSSVVLPLAISFYTFQQIAFLVDIYRREIELEGFGKYLFFVLFFPQLIAGPIVHYRGLISQVDSGALGRVGGVVVGSGVMLISIGVFKKVVLADGVMEIANGAFGAISTISSLEAWVGIVAYSLGIYFDFSAYSDMAIGLGLLFGIVLPINFASPYKARNIVEFWRRWHITLSDFLKYYIYIPLGGNRHGRAREMMALVATMGIGGVWHGVGWTFVVWGLAHGLLLGIIHLYRDRLSLPFWVSVAITSISVTLLWVLFRAGTLQIALEYYGLLFGFGGGVSLEMVDYRVLVGLVVVWGMPNSMQIVSYPSFRALRWYHALWASIMSFVALQMMATAPAMSFVYFNF
jgi:alginate O-acetyltransferase complex protein AlgI